MASKKTHHSSSRILSYLKGKGSQAERYQIERSAQADPFELEAMEGLESIPPEELEADLLALHDRLWHRIRRRRKNTWIGIAATIASVLIVGTVFLQIHDYAPSKKEKSITEAYLPDPGPAPDKQARETEIEAAPALSPPASLKAKKETAVKKAENAKSAEDPRMASGPADAEKAEKAREPAKTAKARPDETPLPPKQQARKGRLKQHSPTTVPSARKAEQAREPAKTAKARPDETPLPPKQQARKGRLKQHSPTTVPSARKAEQAFEEGGENEISTMVSGQVISADNLEPMPGVSLVVKGTSTGTVSDSYGRFSLPANSGQLRVVASQVGSESQEFILEENRDNELVMQPEQLYLQEVVVIGYDKKENSPPTGAISTFDFEAEGKGQSYDRAHPKGGFKAFSAYVENEQRWPSSDSLQRKQIVVLSFRVDPEGQLHNIKVLRSPGEAFSSEALRLLNEGPAWVPAAYEDRIVEDRVRLRLVFKPRN